MNRWVLRRPDRPYMISMEEALNLAALRIKHTVGMAITETGQHVDLFDPEGELLFGKVLGIVVVPERMFSLVSQRDWDIIDRVAGETSKWCIVGATVREP